jgi:hypothetical protein
MIETNKKLVLNDHVIEIGRAQEYGYVRVSVVNNAFTVSVHDQFDRPIAHHIYAIKRNLTEEEIAFMDAYDRNVGGASPNVVEAFLRAETHDHFCEEYGTEYYSGLADAHGVWYDALVYARGSK